MFQQEIARQPLLRRSLIYRTFRQLISRFLASYRRFERQISKFFCRPDFVIFADRPPYIHNSLLRGPFFSKFSMLTRLPNSNFVKNQLNIIGQKLRNQIFLLQKSAFMYKLRLS